LPQPPPVAGEQLGQRSAVAGCGSAEEIVGIVGIVAHDHAPEGDTCAAQDIVHSNSCRWQDFSDGALGGRRRQDMARTIDGVAAPLPQAVLLRGTGAATRMDILELIDEEASEDGEDE
jgi:hypothetical protein